MNAKMTVLTLMLGSLLAACGTTTLPAVQGKVGTMHALEECHGCGILPSTSGTVERFWAWNERPELLDRQAPESVSPVSVAFFPTPVQAKIVEERPGLIRLTIDPDTQDLQLKPGDESLPVACASPDTLDRPWTLAPEDGGWDGHAVQFTAPEPAGSPALLSAVASDQLCTATFGPGWQALTQNLDPIFWRAGSAAWSVSSQQTALR